MIRTKATRRAGNASVKRLTRIRSRLVLHKKDLLALLLLSIGAFGLISYHCGELGNRLQFKEMFNVWVNADPSVIYNHIGKSDSIWTKRTLFLHPLFNVTSYPLSQGLKALHGGDPVRAVRDFVEITSVLWVGLLYVLLRSVGAGVFIAATLTIWARTSGGALLLLSVPETYCLSSITVMLVLLFASKAAGNRRPRAAYVLANVVSGSMLLSNLGYGALLTFLNHRVKDAIKIFLASLLAIGSIIALLNVATNASGATNEAKWLFTSGGLLRTASAFLFHASVLPEFKFAEVPPETHWFWPQLTVQGSLPGSGSVLGALAIALWGALLAIAAYSGLKSPGDRKLVWLFALSLAGQFTLHYVYGNETILYSLGWLPVFAAFIGLASTHRKFERPIICLAVALTLIGGINNLRLMEIAISQTRFPQENLAAFRAPSVAEGGLRLASSPTDLAADSYGVVDPSGLFRDSSSRFGVSPLSSARSIEPGLSESGDPNVHGRLVVRTGNSTLTWKAQALGKWQLTVAGADKRRTALRLGSLDREVGPIWAVFKDRFDRLVFNFRWYVEFGPSFPGVKCASAAASSLVPLVFRRFGGSDLWDLRDDSGHAYCSVEMPSGTSWQVTIIDSQVAFVEAIDLFERLRRESKLPPRTGAGG